MTGVASPLILCVDDESVGLHVRRMLLERAGYRVLTAIDGESGLDLFRQQPVEAVVLDYSMPGMSGGEVARQMRDAKPYIPILMLSAYTSLPPEVGELVDLSMTKGEGAPALLKKLDLLMTTHGRRSQSVAAVVESGRTEQEREHAGIEDSKEST